jgi:hypothetical protein
MQKLISKINNKKTIVLIAALVAGVTVGSFTTQTLASGLRNRSQDKAPKYPVNSSGQTYGSVSKAISEETEPDLIAAIGLDGTKGYVLSKDLQDKMPKTPEEAVAITKEIRKASAEAKAKGSNIIREVPLYSVDGKTVIGKFGISGTN